MASNSTQFLMPATHTEHIIAGHLADRAAHDIRLLNHGTRPATDGPTQPGDPAEIIAALASMTGMLPQLLGQLAHWLEHQQHDGRLRVDTLTPPPTPPRPFTP